MYCLGVIYFNYYFFVCVDGGGGYMGDECNECNNDLLYIN